MLGMVPVLDPARPVVPARRVALVVGLEVFALSAAVVVAGVVVAIWRGFPPHALSPAAYVEMQQGAIRGMNLLWPVLGLVTILATAALAFLVKGRRRWLFLLAIGLFGIAGLITRLGNQPINAMFMGRIPEAPPAGWEALRDRWWTLHLARTASTCGGCLALVLGCVLPSVQGHTGATHNQ
jgi:hypothetical protein